MAIREPVRECLEKDPADRTPEDIDILLEFTHTFPAFFNMTLATRRALCAGKETQLNKMCKRLYIITHVSKKSKDRLRYPTL